MTWRWDHMALLLAATGCGERGSPAETTCGPGDPCGATQASDGSEVTIDGSADSVADDESTQGAGSEDGNSEDTGAETKQGYCLIEFAAVVNVDQFIGQVDYILKADASDDERLCWVSTTISRVGSTEVDCQFLGEPCLWTHEVELSTPIVSSTIGDTCERTEDLWQTDPLDSLEGQHWVLGLAPEINTDPLLLRYDRGQMRWDIKAQGYWQQESGDFRAVHALGECDYTVVESDERPKCGFEMAAPSRASCK